MLAVHDTREIQPARLRLARSLRGLRQNELASKVGVTAAAISQFENGAALPSLETLERLSVALKCRPLFFIRPWVDRTEHEPFFRRRRATAARELDRAHAYAITLAEIVGAIERHVELPPVRFDLSLRIGDETPLADVERAADQVRAAWRIPEGPIAHVVRLLESRGAVAAAVGAFDPTLDAFSLRTGDRPIVVLCSDHGAAARRRFDAAHELAHLLLHDSPAEANHTQEQQAHRFAAALLMPADQVDPWLPRFSNQLELLEEGSRIWGVSMQALLFRSRTVGAISEDGYRRTMRRMSAAGWRTREPVELGPAESPTLLRQAVAALPGADTSLAAIADELGLPLGRLARMLSLPEDHDDAVIGDVISIHAG